MGTATPKKDKNGFPIKPCGRCGGTVANLMHSREILRRKVPRIDRAPFLLMAGIKVEG